MEFFDFISEQWVLVSIFMTLIYLYAINERAKSGKTISPHVVTRMINSEEAILLDVREIKDFSLGHIAGRFAFFEILLIKSNLLLQI